MAIVKWRGIIVEVANEDAARLIDEVINDLVIPFKVVKSGADFMVECRLQDTINVAGLTVPLVFEDYCDSQGCTAVAYIRLPSDHPLRSLVRRAVEETWAETVRKVKLVTYGIEILSYEIEFDSNAELETVAVRCRGFSEPTDRETVFQVPLKTLREKLEKMLRDREKLLKIVRDTIRMVEEVEKRLKDRDVDVEFLERKLEKSYLSIIQGDELDVEF